MSESLFKKVAGQILQYYQKKTPTQVFFCEIYEMFQNTFFTEHFWWLLLSGDFFTIKSLNPFHVSIPFLYQLKASKLCFQGGLERDQ